jgi:pantothenate kinase
MLNDWQTFSETEKHREIRDAIRAEMGGWRRFIIAVDGVDGAGKSNLARYLAWQLGMPAIETDLFLKQDERGLTYRLDGLRAALLARTSRDRPLIIEGIRILQTLQDLALPHDFLVWVECDGYEGSQRLGADLDRYQRCFNPKSNANAVFIRKEWDGLESAV